jgi:uncharacterized membrane protein
MNVMDHLIRFDPVDRVALAVLAVAWMFTTWITEHPPARLPSVSLLMQQYRRDWMVELVTRPQRIFDAALVDSLRQGTAFFGSACMLAIGGGVALIGNAGTVSGLTAAITQSTPAVPVEWKIILVVGILANALLKFAWANRLFGYCAVLMAAVPNEPQHPQALHRASQAAEINITAARSFNRGLQSIYYALAALGWLINGWGLTIGIVLAAGLILRREFASESRQVLLQRP